MHPHAAARPWINPSRPWRTVAAAALALAVASTAGCAAAAFLLKGSGLDKPRKVKITAEYRGLMDKTTAVLINASQATYYDHPDAPLQIGRAVSLQLRADVPGIEVVNPDHLAQFQIANPYWNTLRYGELVKRLNVDRLVYVDVIDFTLRERGNDYVWNGNMIANIGVVEADGDDPNDFAYATTVQTAFPPDESVGVLNSDDKTIQAGMLATFAQQVADLFHDHKGYE